MVGVSGAARARRWVLALVLAGLGCTKSYDPDSFRREAERTYLSVHPGWSIVRRDGATTVFVRGDQLDSMDTAALFGRYQESKQGGGAWFEAWSAELAALAKARRRSLDQAADAVLPVLKSGSWIRVQDVGAIGPRDLQDKIKPWRKEVASELFVLLGVPEERLGVRLASIDEVNGSREAPEVHLERAITNLRQRVGTATGSEIRGDGERLLVYDLSGTENVAALILDARFRERMLERFGKEELGAAVPIKDVLVVFHPAEFTAVRPVRARAHQLYDTQNHPAFRGLLRFDRASLSVLEGAEPHKKKPAE